MSVMLSRLYRLMLRGSHGSGGGTAETAASSELEPLLPLLPEPAPEPEAPLVDGRDRGTTAVAAEAAAVEVEVDAAGTAAVAAALAPPAYPACAAGGAVLAGAGADTSIGACCILREVRELRRGVDASERGGALSRCAGRTTGVVKRVRIYTRRTANSGL